MKIEQSNNKVAISDIRKQITDSAELDKFNDFLSKYKVIDFADQKQQEAMASCCGGDHCCETVNFTTTYNAS